MIHFNKKGITFPLENLVALILSIIILFFLLQLVYGLFNYEDTNLDISKNNAQSITNFVNYFSSENYDENTYLGYKNCFFILKLSQLENFQSQSSNNKYYAHYITSNGVGVLSEDKLLEIKETDNPKNIKSNYFVEFKKPVKIIRDTTDASFFAKVDLLFGLISFGGNNPFELDTREFSFLFLSSKKNIVGKGFDNSNSFKGSLFLNSEELTEFSKNLLNLYKNYFGEDLTNLFKDLELVSTQTDAFVDNIKDNRFDFLGEVSHPEGSYVMQGNSLVFSQAYNGEKILFLTSTEYSDIFVGSQICSKKYLEKQNKDEFYKSLNYKEIDYFNHKIEISCDLEEGELTLIWDNEIKCESNIFDCEILNSEIKEIKNYKDLFLDSEDEKGALKITEILNKEIGEVLTCKYKRIEKNLDQFDKQQKVFFDDIFEPLNFNYNNKGNLEGKNILELTEKEREELIVIEDANENENVLCNYNYNIFKDNKEKICDDIIPHFGDAYFYLKGDNWNDVKYYKIKQNVFRKKSLEGDEKLYFLGDELKVTGKESDTAGYASIKCEGFLNCVSSFLGGGTDDIKIIEIELNPNKIKDYDADELFIYMTPKQFLNVFSFDEGGLRE